MSAKRSLYDDLELSPAQISIVREYLRSVDFHLPGASCDDFAINPVAKYLGYMFQKEDLEAYAVGLKATDAEHVGHNTFIRMSRDQLLGKENPKILPVNQPVMATSMMTMQRFWDDPRFPETHGINTFAGDNGVPGVDHDLLMLETQLQDIRDFKDGGPVALDQEILDLKINWGVLLAGRYPRLKHYQNKSELSPEQNERLSAFEQACRDEATMLSSLGLATLDTLATKPKQDG